MEERIPEALRSLLVRWRHAYAYGGHMEREAMSASLAQTIDRLCRQEWALSTVLESTYGSDSDAIA
jgi:hypothetical protein